MMSKKEIQKKIDESTDKPFINKMWQRAMTNKKWHRTASEWDGFYLITGLCSNDHQDRQRLEGRHERNLNGYEKK